MLEPPTSPLPSPQPGGGACSSTAIRCGGNPAAQLPPPRAGVHSRRGPSTQPREGRAAESAPRAAAQTFPGFPPSFDLTLGPGERKLRRAGEPARPEARAPGAGRTPGPLPKEAAGGTRSAPAPGR